MRTSTLICLACCALSARAQSAYTFAHDTVPFLTIGVQGGVVLPMDGNDEYVFTELDGETFHFFGVPFTLDATHVIAAGAHGTLRVRNDTAEVVIDALHTPLEFADPGSAVLARITGPPGDHLLEVEWRDWGIENGPPSNIGSFAVAVHQASGIIELHYGTSTIGGTIHFDDITGPLAGVALVNSDMTSCHEKLWVEQDALAPTLDSLPNLDFDGLHNVPLTHVVYRFTPRAMTNGLPDLERPVSQAIFSDHGDHIAIHPSDGCAYGLLRLFDGTGRAVKQLNVTSRDVIVPAADLRPGMYVLRYTPTTGPPTVWKFARP